MFSRSANAAELAVSELFSVVSIWNIKQNTVCQVNHADYTCAFAAIELKKKVDFLWALFFYYIQYGVYFYKTKTRQGDAV